METYTLAVKTNFDACHFIPNHPGKCLNLHGHTWNVEVAITLITEEHYPGILLDFSSLKKLVKVLVNKYDHSNLNNHLDYPSAENIAKVLALKVIRELEPYKSIICVQCSIQEGAGGTCTFTKYLKEMVECPPQDGKPSRSRSSKRTLKKSLKR